MERSETCLEAVVRVRIDLRASGGGDACALGTAVQSWRQPSSSSSREPLSPSDEDACFVLRLKPQPRVATRRQRHRGRSGEGSKHRPPRARPRRVR